ncbi:hypothetical protein [Flavobacterium sp.]|uniref:hypothetical protein n=1 Tax=Flavobacterium sp. TaxID=239 RepID=UPI0025BCC4EA|nr:hypothetical protein [Flavobacterium sp.]
MKNFICVLFLGLGLSGFAQTDYGFVYDPDAIIASGTKLHDEGKYEAALKEFDKIDPIDPNYVTAQYEKALTYKAMEQPEKSREIYEKAYNEGLMKDRADFFMAYGTFLSDAKEYDKSEIMLLEGQKLSPDSGPMLYNLALLYLRKEQRQKAIDLLKKSITLNPNHSGSHYLLGSVALEEGHVTEGAMGLLTYLILNPNGPGAEQCIIKLNAKFGENYLEKSNLVLSKSGDNFSEIDEILRNQLALRSAFKVKSEFTDIIIRQVQAIVEYAPEHKMGDGFFETMYIPYLAELSRKNQFEGMSYYILLSMEEKLGKKLTSQKKKILSFRDDFIYNGFWPLFAKRKLDFFGKEQDVTIFLDDNGSPSLIGTKLDGKREGKFKAVYSDNTLAAELNFVHDELDGLQKYYDRKGKLYEEKSFSKGQLDGKRTTYYKNGNLKLVENYRNGKLQGLSSSYFINGGKSCEVNFTDDERDGNMVCLYENGAKKSDFTYVKGKNEGVAKYFNESGAVTSEIPYTANEINGKFVEYFDGKIVKSEADYENGKIKSYYKSYYPNGSPDEQVVYENGFPKSGTSFFENGKKSFDTKYTAKGEVEGYAYYNQKGDKYYEEKFKSGLITTALQYKPGVAKPIEIDVNKKGEDLQNFDGVSIAKGKYDKGKKTGEWTYSYQNGMIKEKEIFAGGVKSGLNHGYNNSGRLVSIVNYVKDTISGVYESHSNGKVSNVTYYKGGERNGVSRSFYGDGSLSSESFYDEGEIQSNQTFWQNGKPSMKTTYDNGSSVAMESFTLDGKSENKIDYTNKTGKVKTVFRNGHAVHEYEMVNGVLNGKYTVKDKSGKLDVETVYVNGSRHGRYVKNGPTGALLYELNYDNGEQIGLGKYHDLAGNLRITIEFLHGTETGKLTRYFYNKNVMYEYNQFDELNEGEAKYYNLKGEPILIVSYAYNLPEYYIPLDANGKLTQKVPLTSITADIVSKYPNGKTAIEMHFNKGILDKKFLIFSADGKPEHESNYDLGLLNGPRIEYYTNGKIYKKENFVYNDDEGLAEFFKEDGKPWISATSKNDELHGPCKIYTATGTITKMYDSDELVDVK